MVVLHLKKTELNQFLYETYCGIKCEDLLNELCESKKTLNHSSFAQYFTKTCDLT